MARTILNPLSGPLPHVAARLAAFYPSKEVLLSAHLDHQVGPPLMHSPLADDDRNAIVHELERVAWVLHRPNDNVRVWCKENGENGQSRLLSPFVVSGDTNRTAVSFCREGEYQLDPSSSAELIPPTALKELQQP